MKVKVIARCHNGAAKILCYMGYSGGVAFLISERGYYALQRGEDITPLGFPGEDVFECPDDLDTNGNPDWGSLSVFQP